MHLVAQGWKVYATARRPETLADLRERGCETLSLDVTDEASMQAAVEAVSEREGAVGVLVNNAGYSQSGALETVQLDQIRRQFETNVFGLLRMCQLVLPGMRRQRWGKIVNISSMGGRLTFPGGGVYHATKYAVEALSDALRFEVRGFGVDDPNRARADRHGLRRCRDRDRRARRRWPVCALQQGRRQAHHRGVQGSDGEARRRTGGRGEDDRARAGLGAPEVTLSGDAERPADDHPAAPDAGPAVGSGDAHTVPDSEGLSRRSSGARSSVASLTTTSAATSSPAANGPVATA